MSYARRATALLLAVGTACGAPAAEEPSGSTPPARDVLAFASERREVHDIELIRVDGTGRTNLTRSPRLDEQGPSWSPDGKRLAFAKSRPGYLATLFVMKANGRSVRALLGRRAAFDLNPAWAPRGEWIAFDRAPPIVDVPLLMRVRSDGRGLRRLATTRSDGPLGASWSPDGRTVAYTDAGGPGAGRFSLGQGEVFVVGVDGRGRRRLTRTLELAEQDTAWSPDGRRIAVTAIGDAGDDDIWVINADGSNPIRLTENVGSPQGDGLDAMDFGPAWSPDGTRIAFTSGRDGNFELYVMNADGSCETRITRTRGLSEVDVAWRPRKAARRAEPIRC